MDSELITGAAAQYGFAGMCGVLLAMVFWLVRRIIVLLEETASVIAGNTDALRALNARQEESVRLYLDLRDRMLTRPCMAKRDAS